MRIIGGELKGRRLKPPSWDGLRPTSDKLRETLFNVVAARVPGARVLDLYAGTGAIGIEALSRGASHVTFVDTDTRALKLVEENLRRIGVSDRYVIIRTPQSLPAERLVAPDGLLVLEHARRRAAPDQVGRLRRTRDLISGDSALAFYL